MHTIRRCETSSNRVIYHCKNWLHLRILWLSLLCNLYGPRLHKSASLVRFHSPHYLGLLSAPSPLQSLSTKAMPPTEGRFVLAVCSSISLSPLEGSASTCAASAVIAFVSFGSHDGETYRDLPSLIACARATSWSASSLTCDATFCPPPVSTYMMALRSRCRKSSSSFVRICGCCAAGRRLNLLRT